MTPTPEYRTIPLTHGHSAIVDAADYECLCSYKWHVMQPRNIFYARSWDGRKKIYMHRALLCAPPDMQVDHINGNGLDNRRSNLRLATNTQNQQNSRIHKDNMAGLKGVRRRAQMGKWTAQIRDNGRRKHLGFFHSPEEAYAAYCEAAKKYHGEFARLA